MSSGGFEKKEGAKIDYPYEENKTLIQKSRPSKPRVEYLAWNQSLEAKEAAKNFVKASLPKT